MRTGRTALLCVLLLLAVLGAGIRAGVFHGKEDWPVPEEAKKVKNPVPSSPASVAAGKTLYRDDCAQCHGEQGKGDGPEADMYDPKPTDISDAHMMSEMTDGEIFYKISEGRRPMPSFKKKLTEEQRWQIVNFVRTLAPKLAPAPPPPAKKSPRH